MDTKYWHAGNKPKLDDWCKGRGFTKVLDVGGGKATLQAASHIADIRAWADYSQEFARVDICNEPLPFADKEFELVSCTHVLEDIANPAFALREILRVARWVYLECPSPLQDVVRGVDAGNQRWRGYHHHRWFVSFQDAKVVFLPKYGIVEHIQIPGEFHYEELLEKDGRYWNDWMLGCAPHVEIADMQINTDFHPLADSYTSTIGEMCKNTINRVGTREFENGH